MLEAPKAAPLFAFVVDAPNPVLEEPAENGLFGVVLAPKPVLAVPPPPNRELPVLDAPKAPPVAGLFCCPKRPR